MNIVTSYTKNQLDRSAYISEDKYKKAFDINRIRLATQRLAGVDNKYAYYYNLYIFQNLVARLNKLGIKVSDKVTPELNSYILDDERQIELAEETWGKKLIDEIIDVVTSDEDLGDYDKPKTDEEIKKEAEEDASSDSDSDDYKMPPFIKEEGKEGEKTNPIQEKVEEEAKDKTEEISKDAENGGCDAKTIQEEFIKGADNYNPEGGCADISNTGFCVAVDSCTEVACVIEYGDCASDTAHEACIISCTGDANNGATDYGCANVMDRECDCGGNWADLCGDTPTCNEEPCGDCDGEPCGDCDTCAGGDCCVSDIPCADTPPCDTCGAGDYEPPPCDTCSGDSGGCPANCCVADCCVGDKQCASDWDSPGCNCCVNDTACTNVSCGGDMPGCSSDSCDCATDCGSNCDGSSCDCGNDCDNYGDCIDACGGND
jgi:hypothetical protein